MQPATVPGRIEKEPMRTLTTLLVLLLANVALAASAPQGHPHFNDGGTLQWQTKFAEAKAAAKKADRLILVEYGRKA
jgi:hypothetical protein